MSRKIALATLLLSALTINSFAETLTIYNTPYTYDPDFNVAQYAQTDQFVISTPEEPKYKTNLNNVVKYAILQNIPQRKQTEEKNAKNTKEEAGKLTTVFTLHYPLNVYKLTTKQKVDLIAKLQPYKDQVIYVEGFTDCSGPRGYNNTLAFKRARTVASFLLEHGFRVAQLPSYGKYQTLLTSWESRRVEIYVKK